MAIDEWGIWVDNEPGTPQGFLYQQNTMRSALCAALMLHIFHKYADRIRIANLAQTVNVLQAILLTQGDKLVKTPTYHVFDLLKGHQDADSLSVEWESMLDTIQKDLPRADLSSSIKGDLLTVSLVNLSAESETDIEIRLPDAVPVSASGRLVFGRPTDHNTFDRPEHIKPVDLEGISLHKDIVRVSLPPCAIASMQIRLA